LKRWRGNGVISRSVRKGDLKKLLAAGLSMAALFAGFSISPPRVCPNEMAIGRLAVERFFERALCNIAFFANKCQHGSSSCQSELQNTG
jgi:hypothetical protein